MGCTTQGKKAAIIKELRKEGYKLKYLLNGLKMPKSTYYYEINKVDAVGLRNAELTEEIKKIFNQHKGRYGVRRIHRELLNRGYEVNHKRVQRIMHSIGLRDKRPKDKYHSFKGEVGKIAANIIDRDFAWGKCYLSPIPDMCTNEIISYDLSTSPSLNQISRMLEKAFKKFGSLEGLIFHSNQGWQYQHQYYRQELKNRGIIQSMSRRGNCIDNCIMETFFGRLKNEMYYGSQKDYDSFESFSRAIDEYISYYNNVRIQRKTKWMPPVKYRIASMCSA